MAKRKPPSQRPEKQMNETAQAIARLREQAESDKAAKAGRLVSDDLKAQAHQARNATAPVKPGGGVTTPSTRRQKSGGG